MFTSRIPLKIVKRASIGVTITLAIAGGTVVASNSIESVVCVNKQTGAIRPQTKNNPCNRTTERSQNVAAMASPLPADATSAISKLAMIELSVCDGKDADKTANELCKIGMTGPGGGPVFFVDYHNEYDSFCPDRDCNYLEAAEVDSYPDNRDFTWCGENPPYFDVGYWSNQALGAGRTNTEKADARCTTGAIQEAASETFNGKTDWWLPSIAELRLMFVNLSQTGAGNFHNPGNYWSSTEWPNGFAHAYVHFNWGEDSYCVPVTKKTCHHNIRLVRAF